MRRFFLGAYIGILVFFSTGCAGQRNLDEITIVLTLGMDLDPKGKLIVYTSSPVFSSVAKEISEILQTEANSLRQSRGKLNDKTTGKVLEGKTQTLLVGKDLIKKRQLFPYLDVEYRDPKNSMNANLVVVDGSVEQVMTSKYLDKPPLSVYLNELVDNANDCQRTARTTLQQFHRQNFEKGITPYCTEITKKGKDLVVTGTALFNKKSMYATSINNTESSLLLILQKNTSSPIPLTLNLPPQTLHEQKDEGTIGFQVDYSDHKLTSSYKNNQFQFDIQTKISVVISESTIRIDFENEKKKLESILAKQLKTDTDKLIKKIQKHKIDPIGLGLYARAYHYKEWKKVDNDWGKALSKAQITFTPTVKILSYGSVK